MQTQTPQKLAPKQKNKKILSILFWGAALCLLLLLGSGIYRRVQSMRYDLDSYKVEHFAKYSSDLSPVAKYLYPLYEEAKEAEPKLKMVVAHLSSDGFQLSYYYWDSRFDSDLNHEETIPFPDDLVEHIEDVKKAFQQNDRYGDLGGIRIYQHTVEFFRGNYSLVYTTNGLSPAGNFPTAGAEEKASDEYIQRISLHWFHTISKN